MERLSNMESFHEFYGKAKTQLQQVGEVSSNVPKDVIADFYVPHLYFFNFSIHRLLYIYYLMLIEFQTSNEALFIWNGTINYQKYHN